MTETTEKKEQVALQTAQAPAKKSADIARFTKRKSRKKIIMLAVAVLVAAGAVGWKFFGPKPPLPPSASMPLSRGELVNSISLTGTVESVDTAKVYSKLTSMVQTVPVQVGDHVEAGDLLAQLDTTDLALSIAQQQAEISNAVELNAHNLSVIEKDYGNAQADLNHNLNQQLINAESALAAAQQELNEARRDYSDTKDDHEYGDDIVNKAKKEMDHARTEKLAAQKELDEAKKNGDEAKITEAQEKYDKAETYFDDATDAYYLADREYGDQLSLEGKRLRDARTSYQNAFDSKNAVENAVRQDLDSYQDKIRGQRIQGSTSVQQIALQKLQKDLTDSTVTAPISGTVTAIYAEEGAPAGGGLMFVIENTDSLVVKTTLKEYDIASVKEGQPVTIKADATGEREFEGVVSKIHPAARKLENGDVKTEGSVEFETEVALTGNTDGLRVGVNARMTIVTARKDNVWSVPYDAITADARGHDIVYAARPDAEGKLVAIAVPVTTGLESDFYIEVDSPDLRDGDRILTEPAAILPGAEVVVAGMPADGAAPPEGAVPDGAASEASASSEAASEASSADASEAAPSEAGSVPQEG